ncbi:hypothetical protein MES5069_750039 [Mesorhizobium escarrei]|uniref:Transposase n=1 Tax=Mesorhizobium escarrei TaxID=666018 RepID=A0ABN8KJU6_9HYPH|nr:hypothetical protein MES5069_750039 [Mesorhizobium escarrei]
MPSALLLIEHPKFPYQCGEDDFALCEKTGTTRNPMERSDVVDSSLLRWAVRDRLGDRPQIH